MYSEKAFRIAEKAHAGQKDKAGKDYIVHPAAVAGMLETDEEKAVAYLHDVVEDTDVTLEDLRSFGFNELIVEAVKAITKTEGEDYDDYIERLSENELAVKVKLADMKHNSDITRFDEPTEKDIERCRKYEEKRNRLIEKSENNVSV